METATEIVEVAPGAGPEEHPPRRINPTVMALVMILPLIIILVLGLALIKANQTQIEGGVAPNFTIHTFDGKPFSLSQQRGKVVLINFWASWCGPCRSEAPEMNAIWDEYKNRGVTFIGVAYLDNEKDSLSFMREFGVEYPNGPDDGTLVSGKFHIKGVPETYVVDQKGNLVLTIPGPTTANDLRAFLDKLLQ